jgi:peptidoglycan hydrolase CwlO-like protein
MSNKTPEQSLQEQVGELVTPIQDGQAAKEREESLATLQEEIKQLQAQVNQVDQEQVQRHRVLQLRMWAVAAIQAGAPLPEN